MTRLLRAIGLALLIVASSAPYAAQSRTAGSSATQESHNQIISRLNARVGIVSGGIGGTTIRIATDLASVLDDGDRIRVLPIMGKGWVNTKQEFKPFVAAQGPNSGFSQPVPEVLYKKFVQWRQIRQ